MSTVNTITPEVETLTPEEFVTRVHALCGEAAETPTDYFIRNLDTGKLELHMTKPTYRAYSAEDRQSLWDSFRWSRTEGCWISRGIPYADLSGHEELAASLGLTDGGYFVTLHVDSANAATQEKAESVAPAKPPKAKAQDAPKAKRPETVYVAKPVAADKQSAPVSIDAAEIIHVLIHGSGFEGGKIRIAAFYSAPHTPDEAKKFLKEEYGTGGHSHTFLNGASGFVDYDGSGMKIRVWKQDAEVKLSWITVDSYLRGMVREGVYLTDEEQAKYKAAVAPFRGKAPMPMPRMHYPPVKASV